MGGGGGDKRGRLVRVSDRSTLRCVFQPENAADHQGADGRHDAGQRALGAGRVHADRVDRRVLQAVEKHRVVRPRAPPDGHAAIRHVGGAADPVAHVGWRGRRSQLLPVQTPMGAAARLEG